MKSVQTVTCMIVCILRFVAQTGIVALKMAGGMLFRFRAVVAVSFSRNAERTCFRNRGAFNFYIYNIFHCHITDIIWVFTNIM